jgi:hypothetical protein
MWLNYRLEISIPLSKHDIWWELNENIEKTMIVQERELGMIQSKHLHVDLRTWLGLYVHNGLFLMLMVIS